MLEKKHIGENHGCNYYKTTMKHITSFLKKLFGSRKVDLTLIAHFLVKCAKSHSYVETLAKHADALHLWIKHSYEEDFKRAFEKEVRCTIKKLRIRNASIAFDVTYEPFYGKTRNLHIFNTGTEKKNDGEFHFITCSLINQDKQIPLMALPVRIGEQTKLTLELLRYCVSLFNHINVCIFDRGFYNAELIDFLEAKSLKYLIFVPKKPGGLQEYLDQTKKLGKFEHQLLYSKAKSKWKPTTQIVTCKNTAGYDWIFATNIQFKRAIDYVWLYKKRWQIETNYRVEDEAKIKSKSSNYMIRYFYFFISQLLRMCWVVHKKHFFYKPFKKYLDIIEYNLLYDFLGIQAVQEV